MNKKVKYTYRGMSQDMSRAKHDPSKYYEAQHIKLLSTDTQATGAVSNERGNLFVLDIPVITIATAEDNILTLDYLDKELVYTSEELISLLEGVSSISNQKILGHTETRTGVVLFTSNEEIDCVWEVKDILNGEYDIELLYLRALNFSINAPIQAIFNYENEKIEKIYWVDGVNQVRFLNMRQSVENGDAEELIDSPQSTINFVGNINLTNPEITGLSFGGSHTAGMIQYAYNLYKINGSQTTLSPLTELIALTNGNGLGGGVVNEIVGSIPRLLMEGLDPNYTHIKLYAIKYTSLNQTPSVSIILDQEIGEQNAVTYFDDGRIIEAITLEELLFLGSDPLIPAHVASKDNRFFMANIKENAFDVDLDCRAYGFKQQSALAYVVDNPVFQEGNLPFEEATEDLGGEVTTIDVAFSNVPEKHSSVNLNYDFYRYKRNSSETGATGKYIEVTTSALEVFSDLEANTFKFFKDNEIYRIGIQFYNILGQVSFPKWITDFKANDINLGNDNTRNTVRVNLTDEFYTWLGDASNFENPEQDTPVGYAIIRADRGLLDRTILYQGALSPMMFQVKENPIEDFNGYFGADGRAKRAEKADLSTTVKIPSWVFRTYAQNFPYFAVVFPSERLGYIMGNPSGDGVGGEVYTQVSLSDKLSLTFQYDTMSQLLSPDILFGNTETRDGLSVKVRGVHIKNEEYAKGSEVQVDTGEEKHGGTFKYVFNNTRIFPIGEINNGFTNLFGSGAHRHNSFINPSGDNNTTNLWQLYSKYSIFAATTDPNQVYSIYGTPEISIKGAVKRNYNGDSRFSYANTLDNFISDGVSGCDDCDPIASLNSEGARSLTLMLGDVDSTTEASRKGLTDLFNETGLGSVEQNKDSIITVDVIIPNINIYLGNIYGGNSFEAKKRNIYSQIGEYSNITTNNIYVRSPGDTFTQDFFFQRISKTKTGETLNSQVAQFTELISFPVESSVDLSNRSDLSLFTWDSSFQAQYEDFHIYNQVYSQTSNIILNAGEGSLFKAVEQFDTRIYTSKLKIPGEFIDNWTDLLINESLDLDGKYGPINSLVNFNDQLFTFQDEAVAKLQINPNILIQGSDAISIELGTGTIFHDYNYLTTTSGSINKWGIVPTSIGIYYYDALNKNINVAPTKTGLSLTDEKGLHVLFDTKTDYPILLKDNPLTGEGVVFGFDNYNKDLYFTFHQGNKDQEERKSFTRVFSESLGQFVDEKLYFPTRYINKGERLLLTEDNNKLYESYKGEYNIYFDRYIPSSITLMLNPESDYDCVFNNIQYTSELYMDDIDQPEKTLTHIRAYNEYQDSGKIPLVLGRGKNLRRKFREWKAEIPREGRTRIRNPWIFLQLELDADNNSKFILHDIVVSYTKFQ